MPAPATIDAFLDMVRRSNQVDPDRLEACLRTVQAGEGLPDQPRKLAARLVREGLLTTFQAEQLLLGKYKGFTLAGYRLLDRLGQGGTGTVYLAEHELMRRRVAIKVLPANPTDGPAVVERFLREARAAATLDDPNIVRAFDFRQEGQVYLLIMEFVDGMSLHEVMVRQGPLPFGQAADYIRQAALGLQHAHEANLVHRDVKPANLLVDRNGTVKLLDLGLVRAAPEGGESVTRKYDDGMVMGTADYLAPEQALNLHDVDHRADLYSLGATFYALLAGQAPFQAGTVTQKLLWHQMREPTPIESSRPDMPPEMAEILRRMMAKDPEERYPHAIDVAIALEPFCQGPWPPQIDAPGTGSKVRPPTSSFPRTPSGPRTPRSKERIAPPRPAPWPAADEDTADPVSPTERLDKPVPNIKLPARRGTGWWIAVVCGSILPLLLLLVGGGGLAWYLLQGPKPVVERVRQEDSEPAPAPTAPPPLPAVVGEICALDGRAGGVWSVAFSPDGALVLAAGADKNMHLWDVGTRTEKAKWPGHGGAVNLAAFSRDGHLALSASEDGTARLWTVGLGKDLARYAGQHQGRVWGAAFSTDEREVVTCGQDGKVVLWETPTGKAIRPIPGHTAAVHGLAIRPGPGRREVVTASLDKSARLFNLDKGNEIRKCEDGSPGYTCVACTPDGRYALLGGKDAVVRLWDLDSGKVDHRFTGHKGEVGVVALAPNGKYFLSASTDKTIHLWSLQPRQMLHTFPGHTNAVTGLAFTPAGRHFASSSLDGTVRIWGLPPTP